MEGQESLLEPEGAVLIVEHGARRVDCAELSGVPMPEPTDSWKPISHSQCLEIVVRNLEELGFRIRDQQFALSRSDQQFFGVLDLESEVTTGIRLAVGVRNSMDKSLSAAMCAGERVMVCSNLAFHSQINISRKHTVNVERDFNDRIKTAVASLRHYTTSAAERIARLQRRILARTEADSVILAAFEKSIIGARLLPRLISEWREPRHDIFRTRTAWSLFNCYTEVLKDRQSRQPIQAASETMQFQRLLCS